VKIRSAEKVFQPVGPTVASGRVFAPAFLKGLVKFFKQFALVF
jgi:hypothetical protein